MEVGAEDASKGLKELGKAIPLDHVAGDNQPAGIFICVSKSDADVAEVLAAEVAILRRYRITETVY